MQYNLTQPTVLIRCASEAHQRWIIPSEGIMFNGQQLLNSVLYGFQRKNAKSAFLSNDCVQLLIC